MYTILISWKPAFNGTLQVPSPCSRVAGYQKFTSPNRLVPLLSGTTRGAAVWNASRSRGSGETCESSNDCVHLPGRLQGT